MFTNWFKSGRKTPNLSVLILSDDASISSFVQDTLAKEGCTVHSAATAIDALKLLDEIDMPDVLIGDFRSPLIDGKSFVDSARARFGKVALPPLLFLMDNRDDETAAHTLGIDDLLMKPFESAALMKIISQLAKPTPPTEARA
jgi:DNA-binding response OmpR family regulator